jgi:MFS family permease
VAGSTINEFGNWIGDVALAILVFDRTGSPLSTAALFLSLRLLPALLAPWLATRLEVFPARRILPAVYLGEAAIFATISLTVHAVPVPVVMVLAALDGMLTVVANALSRSTMAAVLKEKGQLRAGNAIGNMGFAAGGALGPALAGLLVSANGPGSALLIDAGTFLAVALLIATAGQLKLETDTAERASGRLKAGLTVLSTHPGLKRLLIASALTIVFGAVAVPVEVVFAKRTLHVGDSGYGLLIAAWGIGLVAGGAAFASMSKVRLPVVVGASAGLIAAGYGGLAISPTLAVACVASAVGGTGNGVWGIAVVTAVQEAIPDEVQSAVMAVVASIAQVAPAIGFILGGVVTQLSSARIAYAISAVGVGVVVLVTSARPTRDLDAKPLLGAG